MLYESMLYLIGGVIVLSWGANRFVTSASHISRNFGISPVIIGLTVVAFGTSAPELAVNISAALKDKTDIAMGNVVGSNIFNVAFILGVCAIMKPLVVSSQLIRIDIPLMIISCFVLWLMGLNLEISTLEGIVLLIGIIFYTALQIKLALKEKDAEKQFEREYSEKGKPLKDILMLVFGLGLLVGGANYFVEGAILMARILGMSEAVIGLTIIAAGTSLPEFATSVAATIKGERDIAIGNVVGSNIFNILAVIGVSSVLSKNGLPVNEHISRIDSLVMVGLAVICLPFAIRKKQLDRWLGFILLSSWIVYTTYLILLEQK